MEKRINEAPCGFLTINKQAKILEVNATLCKWLQVERDELIGKHFETLLSSANRLIFHSYFYPTLQLKHIVEDLYIQLSPHEGKSMPFLMNAKYFEQNGEGFTDCFLMPMQKRIDYELELKHAKQLTEAAYIRKKQALAELQALHEEIEQKQLLLMEKNAQLLALSNTDKLTGISNRRLFQQQLEQFVSHYNNVGEMFSLLIIDIDFFKNVNDTYGHLVGDIVLKELAQLLELHSRTHDIVARYGGEEFAVLLPNTHVNKSNEIALALNKAVADNQWPKIGQLTISIGVATFKEGLDEDSIIELADQALYQSKQEGRNRVTHYDQIAVNEYN